MQTNLKGKFSRAPTATPFKAPCGSVGSRHLFTALAEQANAGSWDKAVVVGSSLGWRLPGQQLTLELCTSASPPPKTASRIWASRGAFSPRPPFWAPAQPSMSARAHPPLVQLPLSALSLPLRRACPPLATPYSTAYASDQARSSRRSRAAALQHRFPGRCS